MAMPETAVSSVGAQRSDRSRLVRWSPLGGLLWVIGIVVLVSTPASGGSGDTAAEVVRQAEENEWYGLHGMFGLLSILLLGWFVVGLALRLRDAGARDEGVAALVGGVIFIVLFYVWEWIGFTWLAVIPEQDAEDEKLSLATTYLAVDPTLWWLLAGAGVGAGVMAIAASLGALRTRSAPAWAGWIGVVLGIISLATVAYVGAIAWFLWILLASVGMLVRSRAQTSRTSNSS